MYVRLKEMIHQLQLVVYQWYEDILKLLYFWIVKEAKITSR